MLWIWIQLWIFQVPDPDPGKSSGSTCGSGSNPCYLSIFGNGKNHLKFKHKEESIIYLPFLFHTTILQNTKSRIHTEITFLFICSFIFCWVRIQNSNYGSGSRQKFRIHANWGWIRISIKKSRSWIQIRSKSFRIHNTASFMLYPVPTSTDTGTLYHQKFSKNLEKTFCPVWRYVFNK